MDRIDAARALVAGAVLVILGAGLVGPYPDDQRAAMVAGALAVLVWLARGARNGA
jgi:hypothetical protein